LYVRQAVLKVNLDRIGNQCKSREKDAPHVYDSALND